MEAISQYSNKGTHVNSLIMSHLKEVKFTVQLAPTSSASLEMGIASGRQNNENWNPQKSITVFTVQLAPISYATNGLVYRGGHIFYS
jgi:hypothetical protein